MEEEEIVPEGQKAEQDVEEYFEGKAMRKMVRNPGKLVRLSADSTLPRKLPDNLVYWNRCETRCDSQRLVSYSRIKNF